MCAVALQGLSGRAKLSQSSLLSIFSLNLLGEHGSGRYHYAATIASNEPSRWTRFREENPWARTYAWERRKRNPCTNASFLIEAQFTFDSCDCPSDDPREGRDLGSGGRTRGRDPRFVMRMSIGDELCICSPSCPGFSVRQYHHQPLAAYVRLTLPLGPRVEFGQVPAHVRDAQPLSTRRFWINAILSGAADNRYVESRASLLATVGALNASGALGGGALFVHATPRWSPNLRTSSYLPPAEYRRVLLDSVFTLCPGGMNMESYRIFEAVEAGSIPILTLGVAYRRHACANAHAPLLESNAPFVWLREWAELADALAPLRANATLLGERQRLLDEWRRHYWRGVAQSFERVLSSQAARWGLGHIAAR